MSPRLLWRLEAGALVDGELAVGNGEKKVQRHAILECAVEEESVCRYSCSARRLQRCKDDAVEGYGLHVTAAVGRGVLCSDGVGKEESCCRRGVVGRVEGIEGV